jgi:hypothetical protein
VGRAQHLCKTTLFDFPLRARRTGFSHRVEASMANRLRPSVVNRNICHFLWYDGVAGEGLRSVGADGELPIQERVLYPAHRPPFIGLRLPGSGPLAHRYSRGTVLLLSFRAMRTRPRTAYSVPKIGKGSFHPLGPDPLLLSGRAAPTSHQAPGLGIAPVQSSTSDG